MSPLASVLMPLGAAVVIFALNRPRMDVIAVMMMVALPMTGVITMSEALMGLADPNIVLLAALFVIGEALVRTGVAQRLGDWLTARAGASEAKPIFLLMVIVAGVGSVMSSTGVVAIFIPIVLRIARKVSIPAGRLMMPLSVAALISGMMTLVATPPNLIVHGELIRQGHEGFGFFARPSACRSWCWRCSTCWSRGGSSPPARRPSCRSAVNIELANSACCA